MNRPSMEEARVRPGAALAVLASVAILSACAGENLFTFPVTGTGPGPEVEITAPTEGQETLVGDSILVTASVSAPAGAASVVYSGVYEVDGSPAYTGETASLNGLVNVSLTNHLRASPGQVAGTAVVVVSVTDQGGETSADSVTVAIVN